MKVITSDKGPKALGPYSKGYITGNLVFTSGQIGIDPETGELAEGIEKQAHLACQHVIGVLEAGGTTVDKVVKSTCFLAEMSDFDAFNAVYGQYFVSKPARSCVAVKQLPKGALCEIEVIAEL